MTTLLSCAQDKWEEDREQVEGLQWTPPKVDWGSLIGQTEATIVAEETINSILYPDQFRGAASTPDNLLFTGPPGCGKGTLAKIIMSKAGCRVFKVDAECISMPPVFWDAFLNIANEERSIVYMDEVDKVFSNHGHRAGNVQRLWEDGDSFPNVLMLATTNDVSKLPAAMRSRFTNQLIFPPLKPDELREKMKRTLKDNPCDLSDEDWQTVGVAGMDGRWVIGWAKAAARRVAQECLDGELRAIKLDDFTATRPTSGGAGGSGDSDAHHVRLSPRAAPNPRSRPPELLPRAYATHIHTARLNTRPDRAPALAPLARGVSAGGPRRRAQAPL